MMDPRVPEATWRFLSSLVALSPKRIVYISCNPETQERDLSYCWHTGYQVKSHSAGGYVSTITNHNGDSSVVVKLQTKQHIEINLDMDELDLTGAESKASYDEIKVLCQGAYRIDSIFSGISHK